MTGAQRGEPAQGQAFPGDVAIDQMADRLAKTRRTQKAVASAVGISEKHLSMILTNQADPSYDLARRLWREVMVDA